MKKLTGQCYCGALKYEVVHAPILKGLCYCKACQVVAGGSPQVFMAQPNAGFRYVKGAPKTFKRNDLPEPVTREFCGTCGTHVVTFRPNADIVIIKVGTLDDPESFGAPKVAIFAEEKREFHQIPEGLAVFPKLPPAPGAA